MCLLGNVWAGAALGRRDAPTPPGVYISGTVTAIERENRVYLSDVTVEDGVSPRHRVLVTLMRQGNAHREKVRVGQRISGRGRLFAPSEARNPGGVDERIGALASGYELSGYILPGWETHGKAVFSLRSWMRTLRSALLAHMARVFGESAPLYQALLLGDRSAMEDDVVAAMRLTGTVHILTVSGMHLSLIAMGIARLLRHVPLGRGTRFLLQTAILAFFTCLTGGAPGTIRAFIMAMLRAWASLRGRRYDPLTALACAALAMAVVNPMTALTASFQFSFFVVLGILLLAAGLSAWIAAHNGWARRFPRACGAVGVSMSAQAAAIPMQLLLYGYVPVFALPMNLLAGALVPVLMAVGALCAAVGALHPELGGLLGHILCWPGAAFMQLSLAVADLPGGICRLPAPGTWMLPLVGAAMALASPAVRLGRKRGQALALCLTVMLAGYLPRLQPAVRYVQLDVGQGDAALIRSGRSAVMVDVGPADSYDALRYLRHEGLTLHTVILTHLDEDHAGALAALLRSEVRVGRIVMARDAEKDVGSQTVSNALLLARQMGVHMAYAEAGDEIEAAGIRFDVLSPDMTLKGSNERSLALYAEIKGTSFLLTGDLPISSEMKDAPDCDVLKVAHHGSKNATSERFLLRATPSVAIISVGAGNNYGHPTERVLGDLAAVGATVYRTDEAGCITLWPSDSGLRVQTHVAPLSSNVR